VARLGLIRARSSAFSGRDRSALCVAVSIFSLLWCEPVAASTPTMMLVRAVNMSCAAAGKVCTPIIGGPTFVSKGPVTAALLLFPTATKSSFLKLFVDGHPAGVTTSVGPGAGTTPAAPIKFPLDGKAHTVSWEEVCRCLLTPGAHTNYTVEIRFTPR
jgi:hypothetical protein